MDKLTARERLRRRAARALLRLPHDVQLKLSGRPQIRHGDEALHPELQLLLSLGQRIRAPGLTDLPAPESREKMRRDMLVLGGRPIEVGKVTGLTVPSPDGPLNARHYAPEKTREPRPLLVFFHGGGFSLGDLDTHDAPCRLLCRDANIHVLSVEYRLAPEFPFPAAVNDADAAFQWAREHAPSFGADSARVAIGGDSAGANLAAVVTQTCKARGEPMPALQLLIYPVVDSVGTYASRKAFERGFLLTTEDILRFGERYVRGFDRADPRLSPLRAPSLAGLSPALVITAAFDPLRDEGEAYAEALRAAGTSARTLRMAGMTHGFINLIGVSDACLTATTGIARALADQLGGIGPSGG